MHLHVPVRTTFSSKSLVYLHSADFWFELSHRWNCILPSHSFYFHLLPPLHLSHPPSLSLACRGQRGTQSPWPIEPMLGLNPGSQQWSHCCIATKSPTRLCSFCRINHALLLSFSHHLLLLWHISLSGLVPRSWSEGWALRRRRRHFISSLQSCALIREKWKKRQTERVGGDR